MLNLFPEWVANVCSWSTVAAYEVNKSYVADNTEYSISDVSSWFQTKIPNNIAAKETNKNFADETFETKVENFRNLLLKVKEIIDGKYFLFMPNVLVIDVVFSHCRFVQRQLGTGQNDRTFGDSRRENYWRRRKETKIMSGVTIRRFFNFCIYALIILKTQIKSN